MGARMTQMLSSEFRSRLRGPLPAGDPRIVSELRAHYLAPPSTLPYNLTHYSNPEVLVLSKSFGWDFYHHYIKFFFGDQRSGFFLEAGALDGEFLSNTLWLERNLAWSGLLIEADPSNYQHLMWKRRRAWTSNSCVTKEPYPHETVFEALNQDKTWSKLRWLYRANSRGINSLFAKSTDELSNTSRKTYSMVQCFPLHSYLLALNITTVDFLSLDIQGSEREVLESLLQKVVVRAVGVEHYAAANTIREGKIFDRGFISYMKDAGYHFIDVDQNSEYFFILEADSTLKHLSDPHKLNKLQRNAVG
ncbi:protein Star-like [Cherax quadricarinatus]|uniref:protein Star-like n=1 Tax=Cherax quadricarinatus TaxID=27406 RepID=UPI00387E8637